MIKFSRKLTLQEQKIAHKTIKQKCFYAHPESILRFILADEHQSLREKAVEIIRKDTAERLREAEERGKQDKEKEEKEGEEEEEEEEAEEEVLSLHPEEQEAIDKANIWKFVVPKINFKAKSYPDLIDWETAEFSEPQLTASFSNQDLCDLIGNPLVFSLPHSTSRTGNLACDWSCKYCYGQYDYLHWFTAGELG